jgi:hypothetical protein
MTRQLIFLTWLLLLFGSAQPTLTPGSVYGPYSGSFIMAGPALKKMLPLEESLVQANHSWSIYCWVKSDDALNSLVLLAGFGEPEGDSSAARYLAVRAGRLSFWSGGDAVISTQKPLTPGGWQFLAATFDEGRLILYSDGVPLASEELKLSPASPVIYLAPFIRSRPEAAHFAGKIANFTLLPRALSLREIQLLAAQDSSRLNAIAFENPARMWPLQTKGQDGLRVPQEQSTLPQSLSEPTKLRTKSEGTDLQALSPRGDSEWALSSGWRLIEASKTDTNGTVISRPGFKADTWMKATVPGTVLTTFVDCGIYPDPDYGLNNLAIPETLNKQDYWYRTEFTPPLSPGRSHFTLTLNGINYSAQVWVNGKPVGEVRGAFTRGEFDVSNLIIRSGRNAVAIRVQPPPHPGIPHEQSITSGPGPNGGVMCIDGPTFICSEGWDWIPGVRDRETGIWQEVTLKATGPVKVGDVHVVTRLPLPDTSRAAVTLTVPLRNDAGRNLTGLLEASFEGATIKRRVTVASGQTDVELSPKDYPQLNLDNPRLWWPNGYGSPELYHLKVRFTLPEADSDIKNLRFGVREISYELTLLDHSGNLRRVEYRPSVASLANQHVIDLSHEGIRESAEGWVPSFAPGGEGSGAVRELADRRTSPFLVIRVNGVRISIKGGNWGLDDSRKRVSRERLEPYFRLHRDAHLTMIRNWCGQNTEEVFYDLADEYGLLVWNDFWLSTQDWNLEPDDPALFLANARDTIERFRNHPSIAIWCGRNEGVPPPIINRGLDEMIRTIDGTRYYMPNSRSINLQDSGPWNYGDPEAFYTRRGRGFSTEIGLPSPPSIETMREMMEHADQWPPSDAWAYHDWHSKGGQEVTAFVKAMDEELGAATSLEDFERKAQLLNYASHRALFEGYNSHLWEPNSGRLMWMTHPAWPSMVWQMYAADYSTHASFYGVKKACEPLHVQLNLPGLETAVINNTMRSVEDLRLSARVFSVKGEELSHREEDISVPAGVAKESFAIALPEQARDGIVFIKLLLRDRATNETLSENFYWYAVQKSGYRSLNDLPVADVDCSATERPAAGVTLVEIDLLNRSQGIALMTEVGLRNRSNRARILPAYASDNFVSLLPGERRRIAIEVPVAMSGRAVEVNLTGWNVRAVTAPVLRAK